MDIKKVLPDDAVSESNCNLIYRTCDGHRRCRWTPDGCCRPTLSKFEGRPKDFSPRARLLNWLGYKLPFDRHDWTVDRCGKKVRYVIDFYNAPPTGPQPVAMHLDVRPALDNFGACYDRLRMFAYQAMGLAGGNQSGGVREQQPNP